MRVKTERLVSVLVLLTLLALPVLAALPESSFIQGSAFYGDDPDYTGHLKGRVEYAVYDTENLSLTGEMDIDTVLNLAGRYIYAYQIWNDYSVSEASVGSFQVMNEDGSSVAASILNDTGAHDDGEGGIAPSGFDLQGMWTWDGSTGYLPAGDHSFFLVFSSDAAPITGNFEVKEGGVVVPGEDVHTPEPATVALVGFGAMVVFSRRRKDA